MSYLNNAQLKQYIKSRGSVGESYRLPVVPLVGNVLFPHNEIPLANLSGLSAADLRQAEAGSLTVVAVPVPDEEEGQESWAPVGVEAEVVSLLKLQGGQVGAVLKGQRRILLHKIEKKRYGYLAEVEEEDSGRIRRTKHWVAAFKALRKEIKIYLKSDLDIAADVRRTMTFSEDPSLVCDILTPYLSLTLDQKLELLCQTSLLLRMKAVLAALKRELDLNALSASINERVRGDLQEDQRRQFLKDQMVAIRRELEETDGEIPAAEKLEEDFELKDLPPAVYEVLREELERMQMAGLGTPEYQVSYNYLSLIRDLSWMHEWKAPPRLALAKQILNQYHFGLESVKDRILEYLALIHHKKEVPGHVLLLSGPPGVGKTSLGKSIAKALGRPFQTVALGGVKDESEIRGHRRTYIGAMPGKIIQALKHAESLDCVVMLDEIDKIAQPEGGVSAALLEVLDREQNKSFLDHYLNIPYDLSGVLFLATANSLENIAPPLLDRMDVVELSSYAESEKLVIAKQHILPIVRKEMGLTARQFRLSDKTISTMISDYTREAGVRQLKQDIAHLGRKVVRRLVEKRRHIGGTTIRSDSLVEWLGPALYSPEPTSKNPPPGVVAGLAWTEAGGEILMVECNQIPQKIPQETMRLTGTVGKIMEESAYAAISWLAVSAAEYSLTPEQITHARIHFHLPDGATPKDGPSAGVAMVCSLLSALKHQPVPSDLAMTGEISLRGEVLPVGGIREKALAACRYGKKRMIIPAHNQIDADHLPESVWEKLEIIPVSHLREALDICELG